jgi:DNA polymerase II large subunit
MNFIARFAKRLQARFLISFNCRRVCKTMMNQFCVSRKIRAVFARVVANRYYKIKFTPVEFFNRF